MSHKQSKLERQIQKELAKLPTTALPPPKGPLRKFLARTWRVVAGTLTLLGVTAALVFWPKVSMSFNGPIDPEDPFSETFTITNNSTIGTLYDVSASVCLGQVVAKPLPFAPLKVFPSPCGTSINTQEWMHHKLRTGESFTVDARMFGMAPNAKLSGADIAILVTYQPFFLKSHRQAVFRFITAPLANGNLYWAAWPLE